jgi:Tol biopolymer transport system component
MGWCSSLTPRGPVVNNGLSFGPSISADELDLYFYSDRLGGFGDLDIWVTTRPSVNDAWGTPVNLGPTVNSAYREHFPSISPDGLVLFFDSTRPGGEGSFDLYMSRRATKHDPWGAPVNLGPVISAGTAITPSISRDGSMLYFSRYGNGLASISTVLETANKSCRRGG